MAQPTATFLDELMAAVRGCVALLRGNRQASSYFDFSQRGLVGALIALVVSIAVRAFGPQLLGLPSAPGAASGEVAFGIPLVGIQLGVAWLVLRQLGRADGFVPFLVASSWATLFEAILVTVVLRIFRPPLQTVGTVDPEQMLAITLPLLPLGIAALVITVNIARLIVTLPKSQVAMLVGAQLIAALFGPILLGSPSAV